MRSVGTNPGGLLPISVGYRAAASAARPAPGDRVGLTLRVLPAGQPEDELRRSRSADRTNYAAATLTLTEPMASVRPTSAPFSTVSAISTLRVPRYDRTCPPVASPSRSRARDAGGRRDDARLSELQLVVVRDLLGNECGDLARLGVEVAVRVEEHCTDLPSAIECAGRHGP